MASNLRKKSSKPKRKSPGFLEVNATFVIKSSEADIHITISGTARDALHGEILSTIAEFMRKFGLTQSNSFSFVPSATIHWRDSNDTGSLNLIDSSGL